MPGYRDVLAETSSTQRAMQRVVRQRGGRFSQRAREVRTHWERIASIFFSGSTEYIRKPNEHSSETRFVLNGRSCSPHLRLHERPITKCIQRNTFRPPAYTILDKCGCYIQIKCQSMRASDMVGSVDDEKSRTASASGFRSRGVFDLSRLFLHVWLIAQAQVRYTTSGSKYKLASVYRPWNAYTSLEMSEGRYLS